MDALSKLFGNSARVKLLRLFIFNPTDAFDKDTIQQRLKIQLSVLTKELMLLGKMGLIKKRIYQKDTGRTDRAGKPVLKKVSGYTLDARFNELQALQDFLSGTVFTDRKEIIKRIRSKGSLRYVVISGIFIGRSDSRLDLLVIGDNIDEEGLSKEVKLLEAEIGREIHYAALSTQEFRYRKSVNDKLVRDVLDFPHEVIVDRMTIV